MRIVHQTLCSCIPFVPGAVVGVHYLKLPPHHLKLPPHQFRFFLRELIHFLS